ncbi:DUF3658 domain-containing protein [Luteimonas terrae]|uniref:DUF3658 domain-containing protein n=1 Tax=Luteimonas terrae TaxID=1530191 RepID=A0A4R5U8D2_9GAMM|nr:DUF3658 domain-containing protein [Luteimonas terrae]TDK30741.1 hypothetical protein E2F49_10355 [Luteimonas terrae]
MSGLDKAALAALLDGAQDDAREAIERLDAQDIGVIDGAILAALTRDWKKAGFITAGVMIAAPDAHEDLPEAVYTHRIHTLIEAGRIEGRGNADDLKTFEIRLAG